MNTLDAVRRAIYDAIVRTGGIPPASEMAAALGLDPTAVADARLALAAAHVIVLKTGTVEVAWAPPFSAVPTRFRSIAGSSSWFAPCAWDAFGIPAALKQDAIVDARCAWSGEPIDCGVRNGQAYGAGVIHLLVPAARFWEDIAYT
jgi:hypothetical protein